MTNRARSLAAALLLPLRFFSAWRGHAPRVGGSQIAKEDSQHGVDRFSPTRPRPYGTGHEHVGTINAASILMDGETDTGRVRS